MDNCSQPGSIDKVYSVIRVNAKFERGMSRKGRNSQQSRTCNQTMQGLSTSGASLASLGEREKHDSLKRERERESVGGLPRTMPGEEVLHLPRDAGARTFARRGARTLPCLLTS